MPVPALLQRRANAEGTLPTCVLLHLDGKDQALKHPLAAALLEANWAVLTPDLRATGETRPANDADRRRSRPSTAPSMPCGSAGRSWDNGSSTSPACSTGWRCNRAWTAAGSASSASARPASSPSVPPALFDDRVNSAALIGAPASLVTSEAYPAGTRMGILAPNLLRLGDVQHLAALVAPRKLAIAEAMSADGKPLANKALRDAYASTRSIYQLHKMENRLLLADAARVKDLVQHL